MQLIGFNFKKISAERFPNFKSNTGINTNINFLDIDKEKIDILKELETIKISFHFSVDYGTNTEGKDEKDAQICFDGTILLSLDKEESKAIFKSWKKKQLPESMRLPLFNLILNKCSIRALQLEEEIGIPSHVPLPRIAKKEDNK